MPTAQRAAAFGGAAVLAGAAAIVMLPVVPGLELSALSEPISKYGISSAAWLFDTGVLLLAVGVAGVLGALMLRRIVRALSPGFVTLGACCVGLVAVVIFPDRAFIGSMTINDWLHWAGSMLTFGGATLSPLALRLRRRARRSRLHRTARWLSFVGVGWFVAMLGGSLLRRASIASWSIGGLVERALAATDVAIVVVLAIWAWRGRPEPRTAPVAE